MTGPHFSLILLPTLRCNADCEYCFEKKSTAVLDLERVPELMDKLLDHMERSDNEALTIYWQGGEVMTLPPHWYEKARDLMDGAAESRKKGIHHSLQSNLIGYDRSWDGLIRDMFGNNIGSSLDFPNLHRRAVGGGPETFNETWLRKYREAREAGIEVGVIALPNAETLEVGAEGFYSYFVDTCGITDFQINTPFAGGPPNLAKDSYPLAPDRLGRFLVDLAQIWLEKGDDKEVKLSPFDELIEYFTTGSARLPCMWQDNCVNEFVCIDPQGNVAQCDCWVASYPEFRYGNIFEQESLSELLSQSEARRKIRSRPVELIQGQECLDCDYLAVCHGGCAVRAYTTQGRLVERDPYCEAYQEMFAAMETAARRLAGERGRRAQGGGDEHPL